ncbi:MAG: chemotaxis protein CheW [Myxococcaceae bacterium]|nr:chemotaxis protein CheW [Myxococcaceae bacterium]
MRHVIFRLDKDRYALPLAAIREVVVPPERFTRVPRAPPVVSGVMNLRGRVVTVVELRGLLGLGPGVPVDPKLRTDRVVLLDRGRRDLGLLVSDVDGIDSIEKVTAAPGKSSPAVRGVARLRGWAVTVLDPDGVDGLVVQSFGGVSTPALRG